MADNHDEVIEHYNRFHSISVAMTVGASNPRLLAKKVRAENP